MKIAYLFLPLYFGLFAGFVGHSVRVGLAGAAAGLILAVLLSAEGNGEGRLGMAAIDAMTGTEFEDYVAARMQRAGWQITFTPASGDYGVDLIAGKDDKSVAVQCKRLGKPVGIAAVQQVVSGARHHDCTKSIVVSNQEFTDAAKRLAYHPQLSVDRSSSAAGLGTAAGPARGLGPRPGNVPMKHAPRYTWRRAGAVRSGAGRRHSGSAQRAGGADLSLVSGPAVGPGLGQHLRLGLEPVPRLGTRGGPGRSDGQRAMGSPADLGAAPATATAVGPGRTGDVEYDRACLGVLEQQDLDADLTADLS